MKLYINFGVIFVLSAMMLAQTASALESNPPGDPQSLTSAICGDRNDGRDNCEVELDVPVSCVDMGSLSPCPIVFFLHGAGGQNDGFKRNSGVHDERFIGVYPQGEYGWNTGPKNSNQCHWSQFDCTTDPNEGDLIASIIAELRSQGASGNVYAVGSSNGAALAHRLAANAGINLPIKGIVAKVTQLLESPERSGPGDLNYNQPSISAQRTTPAVSVLSVMGTEDGLIKYNGGSSSVFGGDDAFQLMPALDSMKAWATHNGCSGANDPIISSHSSDMGTGTATKYEYTGCPDGVVVEHYAIEGGGHNAGGVTIDGEKVNYVLAYDFIRRVENQIPSPTTAPIASPVEPPVSSPTTDSSCINDPSWVGKFNTAHNCDYVGKKPDRRCVFENTNGLRAEEACPKACNPDCQRAPVPAPIPAPITAPVSAPVAPPVLLSPALDSSCTNDPDWAGKFNAAHTCDYVGRKPERRCFFEDSDHTTADVACPGACDPDCDETLIAEPAPVDVESPTTEDKDGPSCINDPGWAGKFNAAHTCDYVAKHPNSRCFFENSDGITADVACPEACDLDCEDFEVRDRQLLRRRHN